MHIPFRYFVYVGIVLSVVVPRAFPNPLTELDDLSLDQSRADAITFATYLPPAPSDDALKRYRIAMTSWLLTDPLSRVVAFSRPPTTHKLAAALQSQFGADRVLFADAVKRDASGGAPVSEWVTNGIHLIRTKVACFIGPEVVVDQFWADSVLPIARKDTLQPVHVTGQRLDVKLAADQLRKFEIGGGFLTNSGLTELLKSANVSCQEQMGSDYFVWRTGQRPFSPADIPAFKFDGYFWDQWINGFAASHAHAVTLKLDAPVYSLAEPRGEFNMTATGPIVGNGMLIKDKKLIVTHARLPYLPAAAGGGKPILPVPKCQGIEKVPVVNV